MSYVCIVWNDAEFCRLQDIMDIKRRHAKTQRTEHCSRRKNMKKKLLILITTLSVFLCLSCRRKEHIDTLTYAVFPHLPDSEYYQELIEQRWKEIEPDIRLIRKDWN